MHTISFHVACPGNEGNERSNELVTNEASSSRRMMINTGCFQGGKKIDPRPRKQLRKSKDVLCGPFVPNSLQLNIEGITANKMCMLSQLTTRYSVHVILLQETHCTSADRLVIPNFTLTSAVLSTKHGLAAFVHEKPNWTLAHHFPEGSATEWLCVDVDGINIANVYKPPPVCLTPNAILVFPHTCLYADDFICQHTDCGYHSITPDGKCVSDWAASSGLVLLNNPKDAPSFFSGRWNTVTNPDLAFASASHNSWHLDRRTLEKLPRSQHRPSLITSTVSVTSVPSEPC